MHEYPSHTSPSKQKTLLIDVSQAQNSARACQIVEDILVDLVSQPEPLQKPLPVDLNAGSLFLTRGVMNKIRQILKQFDAHLETVYTTIPQTQQAALDEGCFVKGQLDAEPQPIRQRLPMEGANDLAIELPNFSGKRPTKPFASNPEIQPEAQQPAIKPISPVIAPTVSTPVVETTLEPATEFEPEPEIVEAIENEVPADSSLETLYVRQTLRSGQTIRFDGNVIIVGDAHAGSEIVASGDIVIWGELKGIAHAGSQGSYRAEIRAMKIEALQLRIADYIARRPDRIFYHKDADRNLPGPEVAKVADGEIKILKSRGFHG